MNDDASDRPYPDSLAHLSDELRRLDLLIRLRAATIPLHNQAAPEVQAARTVYITREEVDWLLAEGSAPPAGGAAAARLRAELARCSSEITTRVQRSLETGVVLGLPRLARLFGLSAFETQTVVICLAPELRRKYDRLYAYLQDDITRKRPSVDLVLELLCETEAERWHAHRVFAETAPLLRCGLLQTVDDPQSPSGSSGLACFLKLDPRICQLLLGNDDLDGPLADHARLHQPAAAPRSPAAQGPGTGLLEVISPWLDGRVQDRRTLVVSLHGPDDGGQLDLVLESCRDLGIPLLSIDAEVLASRRPDAEGLVRLAFREGLLQQAAILLERADALLQEAARPLLQSLATAVAEYGWLVLLSGRAPWTARDAFAGALFQTLSLPLPDGAARATVWERTLTGRTPEPQAWAAQLAGQFRLTTGQIRAAAELAEYHCSTKPAPHALTVADLSAACRQQSDHRLGELAHKIEPGSGWDDIVLPEDQVIQLRELCEQVRHQYQVLVKWGFGSKLSRGKGISALFSGPPGTGKTMAAEVVAHDLELDLYRVDLSGVISKYIGETEKNLGRIFAEAEASNAILFFDEADALFGKRTEISDAHDRYANIEVSYLLQKMEEHEGVVILATNLRQNMDEAFTRRIRFIIDFPFPDEVSRRRIWQALFPSAAPVATDIDHGYLAREFPVAGGNIRNIVLNAAFLAAADGGVVSARHILRGTRREFEKIGKLWAEPR
jgi:ATPase family associated with various cellular activities (AAA)